MRYWEDISIGTIERFGCHRLASDEIAAYDERFTPPAFVTASGEPDREAVPGMMICCVGMRLLVDHFLSDLVSRGSPGVDHIDWPAPARVGDIVGLRTEVLSARALKSRPDMGLINQQVRMHNHNGAIVMRMWSNVLIARREATA